MKGIVFTEFLEMVEENYGYQMVDDIIHDSNVASKGVYTAVGTYDHSEIVALIVQLSIRSGISIDDFLHAFGRRLFDVFNRSYAKFFDRVTNLFDFIQSIDNYIHVEVHKIYPDANLPHFRTEIHGNQLDLYYTSSRKMSSLAEGLLSRTFEFFNEPCTMTKELTKSDGSEVKFTIIKQ